jgi:hypothetical protein
MKPAHLSAASHAYTDVYTENTAMTSVVSYPRRCPEWGDSQYPGNCDGTLFKDLVQRYAARRVADPMMGSGTTRDVINSLHRELGVHIGYWGDDLKYGFNLLTDPLPGLFDFLWIHPPYWNIVTYNPDEPADLSNCETYATYLAALRSCLTKCASAVIPGGRLAVLIGDVRRRGEYTPIVRDVLNLEPELGQLRSIIIKTQHNCRSDKTEYASFEDPPIKHEYCVIFKRRVENATPARRNRRSEYKPNLRREL